MPMVLLRRNTELLLLLFPVAVLILGLESLERIGFARMPEQPLVLVAIFGGALFAAHLWLRAFNPRADQILLPLVGVLSAVGLVFTLRLAPSLIWDQLLWTVLGIAALAVVAGRYWPYLVLRRYKYTAAAVGIGLLLITAVIGDERNGARLWLSFGPVDIQSSELIKIMLVVFLAGYLAEAGPLLGAGGFLSRRRVPTLPYLIPLVLITVLTFVMLVWLKDIGAVALLMATALTLLYVATGRTSFVVAGIIILALNLLFTYRTFDYVQERIDVWLDPWEDREDAGFQTTRSLYAISAGGFTGQGIGLGVGGGLPPGTPGIGEGPTIPAVHTDYVFASISEELGLLGGAGIVAIYLVFLYRVLKIAAWQSTDFGRLLVLGAGGILFIQAAVIIAGNLALIPTTGVTLPFISYGGSSFIVNALLVGLVLRVSSDLVMPAPLQREVPLPAH
jgi:cell division protein FtsW